MSMRKRISLFIASQLVDLDDQSFILYNYIMEDLSNPTVIRNSFTKQIVLQGSPTNNRIFGDAFRMDRKTLYGSKYLGAYFDMSRRTPFTIYNEMNEILESGYCKLDKVVKNGVSIEYHITLFGNLGSFLNSLMYNEDGSKKTLADMRYLDITGAYTKAPGYMSYKPLRMLKACWSYLADPASYDFGTWQNWWVNIISFAPCYNGIPEDFSADKAVVTPNFYANIPSVGFKGNATSNLMLFTNAHDEWELKELRWYFQRPVVRLKAIIDACCDKENNGGWEVELSSSFFNQTNGEYWDTWLTLPMISIKDRTSKEAVQDLLKSTLSPAEYLIAFVKMCGLVIVCDENKVRIMPRGEFYTTEEVIDLGKRVNTSSINITPVLSSSRYYQFGGDAVGGWAKSYKEDYGRDYGIHRVNTGNEFNNDTTIVTDGIAFKDAAEVQQSNLLYRSQALTTDAQGNYIGHFALPIYESVKLQGWSVVEGKSEMTEYDVLCKRQDYFYEDNPFYPTMDFLPKMQFHEDNKPVDGQNVLVYFNGIKQCPYVNTGQMTNIYRLTDDTPDMELLNEGVPCWNFTNVNSESVSELPSFRRSKTKSVAGYNELQLYEITETIDWGEPLARALVGITYDADALPNIYKKYWQDYQKDRFDTDTFLLSCKADLKGLSVRQSLLGKFFYYQGAYFVLNKISNHSLTTWDDTECEFIKVQDVNNYKG